MASYFGEIIEPSTRALFEDCCDEEPDLKTNVKLSLAAKFEKTLPNFETFLVAFGRLSLAFVEAFLTDEEREVIGEVVISSSKQGIEILQQIKKSSSLVQQGNIIICFAQSSLTPDLAFQFAEAVSSITLKCKKVVVFTNDSFSNYKSGSSDRSDCANSVYSLKTRLFKSPTLRPLLNELNILSGIPAGVLSWCEIHNLPAVVYVCYSDSETLDSVTAEPLKGILPCRNQTPDLKSPWMYGGGGAVVGALSNMYM